MLAWHVTLSPAGCSLLLTENCFYTHKYINTLFMHFSFSSLSPSSQCNYSDSSAKHVDSAINSFFAFYIQVHFSSFLLRNSTCNDMPALRLNRPLPNIDWNVCEHTGVCMSVWAISCCWWKCVEASWGLKASRLSCAHMQSRTELHAHIDWHPALLLEPLLSNSCYHVKRSGVDGIERRRERGSGVNGQGQ